MFNRVYTSEGVDPFDAFGWSSRSSILRHSNGKEVARYDNIIVPEKWSQTAVDILVQKYFRKAGVPSATERVSESGVPPEFSRHIPCASDGALIYGMEADARQVFRRIVGHWTYHGWLHGYFGKHRVDEDRAGNISFVYDDLSLAIKNACAFRDELLYMLARQMAAPASPQWFNTGLWWAYGIRGETEGQYVFDEFAGKFGVGYATRQTSDCFARPALSACFIQSLEDTLVGERGIASLVERESRVFKFGGGSGVNPSKLRGEGEPLSGGGVSSGLMSWLKILDVNAGAIKSGGANRRAAKIICLDLDHPDVEEFITWKVREEEKVAALAAGSRTVFRYRNAILAGNDPREAARNAVRDGVPPAYVENVLRQREQGQTLPAPEVMGTDYEGSAYRTVSGQNANNSVRVPTEFMDALYNDGDWTLTRRTDGQPVRTLKASHLWRLIAESAWSCADPGVQFDTIINDWNGCLADGRIRSTNPCCLVGDTLVDTSEGLIPIRDLAAMQESGRELPLVFAFDPVERRPVLRKILRAWCSGESTKLVKVTTDKGISVTATPDHRFLSFQGGYVRADNLRVGSSLRKIARHVNTHRSDRVMIADRTCGTSSGAAYQSRWMWEQVYGPVEDGFEVHHVNDDPTDDRVSNFEILPTSEHRSQHSEGSGNGRWIEANESDLLAVWEYLAGHRNVKGGSPYTPGRWNRAVRILGLSGKVPLSRSPAGGARIRGVSWEHFVNEMTALREAANDRVVKIEEFECPSTLVYDLQVDGVANFAVTDCAQRGRHTLVVHNSEFNWLDDNACNLASLNLKQFAYSIDHLDGSPVKNGFDVNGFRHAVRLWTVVLDISVQLASYPSREIAEQTSRYRTLGLGYANLGALLMSWGIPYDSKEGRGTAAALTGIMHYTATEMSAHLARDLEQFPRYHLNAERMLAVLNGHAAVFDDDVEFPGHFAVVPPRVRPEDCIQRLYEAAHLTCVAARNAQRLHGLRNAQITLIAPTGTIGLLMDCDTTGVEPDFALVKWKQLAGGGYLKIVNQSVEPALRSLGYTRHQISEILTYVLGTGTLDDDDVQGVFIREDAEVSAADEDAANERIRQGVVDVRHAFGDDVPPLSAEGWAKVNRIVCGAMTLEGAPWLKSEHLPVFDCANKCGNLGTRYIAPEGHILMLAAVQPLLSGSASKTVNLPHGATVADFERLYSLAYESGVKCLAMYRDGSKLSQPLMSSDFFTGDVPERNEQEHTHERVIERRVGERRPLPNRRRGVTQKVKIGQNTVFLRTGEYPDGTLGEIFVDMHKEGAAFRALMNSLAISISLGLQHGVPLEVFVKAFTFMKFEPNGAVSGHDRIKWCTSIVDYIFRELAVTYLGRDDLAHVEIPTLPTGVLVTQTEEDGDTSVADSTDHYDGTGEFLAMRPPISDALRLARLRGYEGEACHNCGHFTLIRNGVCLKCDTCGSTSGCS